MIKYLSRWRDSWPTKAQCSVILPVAGLGLYYLLIVPPWALQILDYTTQDSAWVILSNQLLLGEIDLHFGRDFIFTTGPLALLRRGHYYPGNPGFHFVWGAIVSGLLVYAYYRLFHGLSTLHRWMGAAFFLLFPALTGGRFVKVVLILPALLLFVRALDDRKNPRLLEDLCLAFFFAVFALIMFPNLIVAGFWIVLATLIDHLAGRRWWRLPLCFFLGLNALWLMLRQSLLDLPLYVLRGLEVSVGHQHFMARYRDSWEVVLQVAAFACYVLAALLYFDRRSPKIHAVLHGGTAALFFLAFKQAVARGDSARMSVPAVLLTAIFVGLVAQVWRQSEPRFRRPWLLLPAAVVLAANLWTIELGPDRLRRVAGKHMLQAQRALDFVSGDAHWNDTHQKRLDKATSKFPLPQFHAPVDLFGLRQGLVLASGQELASRPVFQTHAATTASLTSRNASFYRSDRAPESVIVDLRASGGKPATLYDSRALLELVRSYRADRRLGKLLLVKKAERRPLRPSLVAQHEVDIGQTIDLKPFASGPIWVVIRFETTFLERLYSLLYKPPLIRMELKLSNGRKTTYRLSRPAASAGFLLSPHLANTNDFERYIRSPTGPWQDLATVEQLRFRAPISTQRWLWRKVQVRIIELEGAELEGVELEG